MYTPPRHPIKATVRFQDSTDRHTIAEYGLADLASTIANRFDLNEQREELLATLRDKFQFLALHGGRDYMFLFHGYFICALGFDAE